MEILKKDKINSNLYKYYETNFGVKETDVWYEVSAVNVWVFRRDDRIITLKCHILNGDVVEYTEDVK